MLPHLKFYTALIFVIVMQILVTPYDSANCPMAISPGREQRSEACTVTLTRGHLWPPVITEDTLHTVLRRRANGESVDQIQPDLIIPTGKRRGQNPPSPAATGLSPSTPSARHTPKRSPRRTTTSPPSPAARFLNLAQKPRP